MDERVERAGFLYERFVFGGDASALEVADRELDAVEADLALARGQIIHGRFLAQRNAAQIGDKRTMSEALRHLGIAEHASGRLDAARERLEASLRLRREIGLMPGVAANMVGLIYIAAAQGRRDDALALASEAAAIAEASGAHAILQQVHEARAHVAADHSLPPPR